MKAQELLKKMYKNKDLESKIRGLKKKHDAQKAFECCAHCGQNLLLRYNPIPSKKQIKETLSCTNCNPKGLVRIYSLH